MTMTMKRLQTKQKHIVSTITCLVVLSTIIAASPIEVQNAFATHCVANPPTDPPCYGREISSTTNYGNAFTTKVRDMSMTTACNYIAAISQWVVFPNGDWLENGYTIGGFEDEPIQCIGDGNSEYSYHAYSITGFDYTDNRDSAVSVNSIHTYEVSDLNKDKTWFWKDNGVNQEAIFVSYASSLGQRTGGETSHHSPTIPNTHLTDIKYANSAGTWVYWGAGTAQVESPFWVKLNCSPSYRHIHAGTTGSATCTEY